MNKETIEKLFNVESFLVLGLIIFNILNLILFSKDSQALLVNSLILLCAYFGSSKRYDKKVVLLSIIHFAFYGVIFESLIIKHSKLLTYRDPHSSLNIPLWLFPIYCSFALGALHTYEIFKVLIQ